MRIALRMCYVRNTRRGESDDECSLDEEKGGSCLESRRRAILIATLWLAQIRRDRYDERMTSIIT